MSWIKKLFPQKVRTSISDRRKAVPEGVWTKCKSCSAFLYKADLKQNIHVCTKCNYHMPIKARERLELFLDEETSDFSNIEIGKNIKPIDYLKFKDTKKYKDRLSSAQKQTGEKDALVAMHGKLNSIDVVICSFEFSFIGGSMGACVGSKFVKACEYAIEHKMPFICFSTSGGARMQEGLTSLMQMAKTSAVLKKLSNAKLPYVSILVNPTFGGVSASLAMLGDINIAEPNALIGFAGPRVIEQTVRETLPEGFQKSEFLLEHGFIDMIIDRRNMKDKVSNLISKLINK
tara:strand:- start:10512 stop:11378 length:867 start_codon:yes stop_codon:yes gene_type:complete